MEEIEKAESKHEEEIRGLKMTIDTNLQELETSYQNKVMAEVARYEKLKGDQDAYNAFYAKEISKETEEHTGRMRKLDDDMNGMLEKERNQRDQTRKEKELKQQKHGEIEAQIVEEKERELKNMEDEYDKQIRTYTDEILQHKSQMSIAQKKIEGFLKDQNRLLDQKHEYEDNRDQARKENERLHKETNDNMAKIAERDKIIHEKEKRIYDLKKRTQELEKFKTVLDYKIKEFKKEIGPREDEIGKMKDETNEIDKKLKGLSGINNTLGLVVDELDAKLSEMQARIKDQRFQITSQTHLIKQFKDNVYNAIQYIQNLDELRKRVEEIYEDPSIRKDVAPVDINPDIYSEYISQIKYLEKSVMMLKQNLQKDNEIHKQDNIRIMKENVELIKEINKLRTETKRLRVTSKNEDDKVQKRKSRIEEPSRIDVNDDQNMSTLEKKKRVELQRDMINTLTSQIQELQNLL